MRIRLVVTAILMLIGLTGTASAQWSSGLEICAGDDPKCQTAGTVALACLGSDATVTDVSLWKDSGDALRVNNGHWQMIYTSNGQHYDCTSVLVQRNVGQAWGSGLRICVGDDPSCQTPGHVAYACWQELTHVGQPTNSQYTGDAIQVANNQWQFYYSHNRQAYACAAVLVGPVPQRYGGQLQACAGNDASCQIPGAIPLACDIQGGGFADPTQYVYTGRSMRVTSGQWQMQYPDQSLYACRTVIVAMPFGITAPSQPVPQTGNSQLPAGSVIIYDGTQCPPGWTRIGQILRPGTAVSGMSYCRWQ